MSEDVALPLQVFFSKPANSVDHKNQTGEEPTSNVNMEREIERNVKASDAVIFTGTVVISRRSSIGGIVDLERRDSQNRTCPDFCADMGRLDMVELIENKGCPMNKKRLDDACGWPVQAERNQQH
jgi:hypothetical protein